MKKTIVVSLSILSMCCIAIGLTGCSNNGHVHSYDKQVISDEYLASSATCTKKATYYYSCECGEMGTETFEYGSPLGHSFTNYISDNNATCTQDGTKTAKCDRCDETDTVEDINSKLNHSYTKQIVSDEYLASSATCTKKATYYYSCECGEMGTETFEYGSTTMHNFVNGSCTYCGKKQEASQGLAFTLLDDETYEVSGIGSCTDTEIVIPSVYNDKPVTSIGDRAFHGWNGLTSVTIPDSVTSIGGYAFRGCSGLTSVTIGNSVTSIGDYAFDGCSSLQYNEYDNAHYLGNTFNPYLVLVKAQSTSITSCKINENTKIICSFAFDGCSSLASITIPDSVTSIGYYAFWNCRGLTSVTIGNSVTSIGDGAFYGCSGIEILVVAAGNEKFRDVNNCIIETETKELIVGCKTSIIPSDGSVTSISRFAFSGCSSLTSVTIPDSVTSIGWRAFSGCSGLTSVTIGNSVTWIGGYAFEGCSGLTSITYKGTIADWNNINKGSCWNENVPTTCVIHCIDGEV